MLEKITVDTNQNDAESTSYQCRICSAHATGYHFGAQSCGACAAFFRRAVCLARTYRCLTGKRDCQIFYKNRALCKACRFEICLETGMSQALVQIPKENEAKQRSYYTTSGLKRNKRFSSIKLPTIDTPPSSTEKDLNENESLKSLESPVKVENEEKPCIESVKTPTPPIRPTCKRSIATSSDDLHPQDLLSNLIKEEMRISERRRILFCEKPVADLLGLSECPFTVDDLRPLKFRYFRKSLRTHLLFVHEYIRNWKDVYDELNMQDRITFFRKCALYHTILDPCYISLRLGEKSKFVLQNGGYVSFDPNCEEGWEDEHDLSKENKKKIYWPLLNRIKSDILEPMINLKLTFEEFVALKAYVSIQTTIPDVNEKSKELFKRQLDCLSSSLFNNYLPNLDDTAKSERFGSIIMLLSSIFETANIFVESHHQVQFFDIWQLGTSSV